MKTEDLKDGMYEITHDVTNPKADRRKSDRNFSALPTWPKGQRVYVEITESENPHFLGRISIFRAGGYPHMGVRGRKGGGSYNHPGLDALTAALQPVEWTNREWVRVHIHSGNSIIERLLESGKITREEVLSAMQREV